MVYDSSDCNFSTLLFMWDMDHSKMIHESPKLYDYRDDNLASKCVENFQIYKKCYDVCKLLYCICNNYNVCYELFYSMVMLLIESINIRTKLIYIQLN